MSWETIIGLEVHTQLKTQSKLFSTAPNCYGATPNSQTSYIDAGLPGVLPVLNQEAVNLAIRFGLAINASINNFSYFERKNYFYPDLPKGYQISQFKCPIIGKGTLEISLDNGQKKTVDIVRAHLEEDAGKSIHDAHKDYTGIDLNRAGTPLLEIVTAPCLFSAKEAITYLKTLHQLVQFLEICDGNMQEGSFRCDVNISLRPKGSSELGTRIELKNLNSFRYIEKAIIYEQARLQELLEAGKTILQETRMFSPLKNSTYAMRSKENDMDYRYFPDPDLLPIEISESMINRIKQELPRLPVELSQELKELKELSEADIDFLLSTPAIINYFFIVKSQTDAPDKLIVNWLKGSYSALLNERSLSFANPPISASRMASLLDAINRGTISNTQAKIVFNKLLETNKAVAEIIADEGFNQNVDVDALAAIIVQVIKKHPQQVSDFKAGKEKLLGFFVGQVMKQTKGLADPTKVNAMLQQKLKQ